MLFRSEHIERRNPEMSGEGERVLETVSSPDYVQEGYNCCVIYRELSENDGFILTAYFATETADWRNVVWKR